MLTTLAILAACVFLVGREESRFGANYLVRSDFENVAGLSEGADVRVGGIRKGTVRSIHLPKTPDGKVVVTMELANPSVRLRRRNSRAARRLKASLPSKFPIYSTRPIRF